MSRRKKLPSHNAVQSFIHLTFSGKLSWSNASGQAGPLKMVLEKK